MTAIDVILFHTTGDIRRGFVNAAVRRSNLFIPQYNEALEHIRKERVFNSGH